jgi:cell fate (sporulation/competence/biofilm development) regulator YlbF (YheA/YmcA/DUF963 family)
MSRKGCGGSVDKDSLRAQAALLGEMLVQSTEYCQYRDAKLKLKGNKELSQMLSQLRQQQLSLHLAQIFGSDSDDAEADLERLQDTVCLEPAIGDFLYAEERFGQLVSELQQVCRSKLGLWSENEAAGSARDQKLN